MRRLAAVATIVAALVVPAGAQRAGSSHASSGHISSAPHSFGGGAGGFASHGSARFAPSSHSSGFASRGPIGFRPAPFAHGFAGQRPVWSRPSAPYGRFGSRPPVGLRPGSGPRNFAPGSTPLRFGSATRARGPYRGNGFSRDHGRHPYNGGDHHGGDFHHHHRGIYWGGIIYPYNPWFYSWPLFTGYVDPWLFGPELWPYGYDDSGYGYGYPDSYAGSYPAGGYDDPYGGNAAPYRDYGAPYASQSYPSQSESAQSQPEQPPIDRNGASRQAYTPPSGPEASTAALPERQPLTLIFNDGRAPQQIHSYLITSTTLTVIDPYYRQIPLDQINIAATEQANLPAGIDFRIPAQQSAVPHQSGVPHP